MDPQTSHCEVLSARKKNTFTRQLPSTCRRVHIATNSTDNIVHATGKCHARSTALRFSAGVRTEDTDVEASRIRTDKAVVTDPVASLPDGETEVWHTFLSCQLNSTRLDQVTTRCTGPGELRTPCGTSLTGHCPPHLAIRCRWWCPKFSRGAVSALPLDRRRGPSVAASSSSIAK